MIFVMLPASHSWAQAQQAHDESRVKAAFVLRFMQYVEWPQQVLPPGSSPVKIGVIGAPRVAAELLQTTSGRSAHGRSILVQSLSSTEKLGDFHVLFIGEAEKARIAEYVSAIRDKPTLVVTESTRALDFGSMINFVVIDDHVKFEIAVDAADRAGLTLSSRLLAVALRVHKGALAQPDAFASCCTGMRAAAGALPAESVAHD